MLENGFTFTYGKRRYEIVEPLGRGACTAAYLALCEHDGLTSRCILKEYAPKSCADFAAGREEFIAAGRLQNKIRQLSALGNQTPPVSNIFEANGTAYIEVVCFGGNSLDKLHSLTLTQYMQIMRTMARTVGYYHRSGYLCLDLKPENIFVMQNAPDDTVTGLVEFIDFDSVRSVGSGVTAFSYTREWAPPEQQNPYAAARVGWTADIYTLGEMVFYFLFGRHSREEEHRGFSKYPFDECRREYRRIAMRPDIQAVFAKIFRGTLRSAAANRFKDTAKLESLLSELIRLLEERDYVVPILPSVSPDFVGRDTELRQMSESLRKNPVLYITGVGGIGKSTLVKSYMQRHKGEYDIIAYLEYDGDIRHTFCDDMQLRISSISRLPGESVGDYFSRKLSYFMQICGGRRVLFILDNFSGRVTKELSRIIDCGYDTVIVTRNRPPKNSFAFLELGAMRSREDIFRLISLNLERTLTREERLCFEEIISLVEGHTLVLELIARQIAAGRLGVRGALELIRSRGFSRFSQQPVGNYKDGEEVYDTLSHIIAALFDAGGMSEEKRLAMRILSLFDLRGIERELLHKHFPEIHPQVIADLAAEGALYADERVRLHSVVAEAVRNRPWGIDDVQAMEYHCRVVDIYVSRSNAAHIKNILREAKLLKNSRSRVSHIMEAMYYDMLASLYDTLIDGAYLPENEEEEALVGKLMAASRAAIEEMERSGDSRRTGYLIKYYLSMAAELIRSAPECGGEAAKLFSRAEQLIGESEPPLSENRCHLCMVTAWYYTLTEPDFVKTKNLLTQAEDMSRQVFATEPEVIDIVSIPAANCMFYHGELSAAEDILLREIKACGSRPDNLSYIEKRSQLQRCLIDVYIDMGDSGKAAELIAEIDGVNEKYREEGIFTQIPEELRKAVKAGL